MAWRRLRRELNSEPVDGYLTIVSKREVRAYADRAIDTGARRRILEAGRVSGSSANKQQWRFIVVESDQKREQLAQLVYTPGNVRGASLIVIVAVNGGGRAAFDAGRASQNMMLAAWNDGIGSCPNGTPDAEALGNLLGLHAGEEPSIILTFGYPARGADPESRSPHEWIERANRKPFDEVVETVYAVPEPARSSTTTGMSRLERRW
jgi:nitroreductase